MSARNFHVQKLAERVLVSKVENFALESGAQHKKVPQKRILSGAWVIFLLF
jgi:hypothetical protein